MVKEKDFHHFHYYQTPPAKIRETDVVRFLPSASFWQRSLNLSCGILVQLIQRPAAFAGLWSFCGPRNCSVQLRSGPHSCLTLCDPMDCSTQGFPVLISPTLDGYSNSCPLNQWYHPTISSSVIPFSSRLQSFPASGSFQMSQFLLLLLPKLYRQKNFPLTFLGSLAGLVTKCNFVCPTHSEAKQIETFKFVSEMSSLQGQ